jgi:acyl-CoA synthetase (AMP-forming)/AMP-acid ligase II
MHNYRSVTDWNLADLWDTVANAQPDAPAIAWGDSTTSWGEFRRRAEALGAHLHSITSGPGARVALYLRNRLEYLEALYACLGARLVPVNTNYRYTGEELAHVWSDADAEVVLVDSLGSSEAIGMGASVSGGGTGSATARFSLGTNAVVIDEDGQPIAPGSATIGRVAVRGRCPIGYHKDPARTAATFPVIDGVRHSVPGDLATVEADGTIHLLGRGSSVINTGGEKVFAEEVEEVLKTFGGVLDAGVVGIDDDRFGSIVTAVVVPVAGTALDMDALRQHARSHLAGFKVPKHIATAATLGRAANAKLDPRALRALVTASMAQITVH